jgi:DNA processing protein
MTQTGPCDECLRRSWIVHCLGPRLDMRHYHAEQLAEVFSLDEQSLLEALDLSDARGLEQRFGPPPGGAPAPPGAELAAICRHDRRYPFGPRGEEALPWPKWSPPPVLRIAGAMDRLRQLRESPAVAVIGTRRATDYGLAVAHRLAGELAGSGLPVLGAMADGVASAAHSGALAAAGLTVAVMHAGVERAHPAGKRALYSEIVETGCAISELPFGAPPRRWSYAARDRIVAGLASLVVVVEAEERAGDLMLARFARELGRAVVAVPGRVTSAASRGTHALIREGVPMVRDAQDVLDALCATGLADEHAVPVRRPTRSAPRGHLAAEAAHVLELVTGGAETADRLVERGVPLASALSALTELELAGELVRGDGGRYLPCAPYTSGPRSGL